MMGRGHSDLMFIYFPKQKKTGIDLGNVEIKELIKNALRKFTIGKKDLAADFILFYDHIQMEYFFVNTIEMPKIKAEKRSISIKQVQKIAYLQTKDEDEFFHEMESIINDKSFLAWISNPTNPGQSISQKSYVSGDLSASQQAIGEPNQE